MAEEIVCLPQNTKFGTIAMKVLDIPFHLSALAARSSKLLDFSEYVGNEVDNSCVVGYIYLECPGTITVTA